MDADARVRVAMPCEGALPLVHWSGGEGAEQGEAARSGTAREEQQAPALATALFAIGYGISVTQLLQARQERRARASSDVARPTGPGFLRTLPAPTCSNRSTTGS